MAADGSAAAPALGLAVALGSGLLIGLERERRKGRGGDREAAGIRTFSLAALGGGLAQALGEPLLAAAGALAVLVLVGVAYWHSRQGQRRVESARDPGLTTELALFVTYLVGVLSVQQPALGAAAAATVAILLAARERLHRFATRVLSDAELHDALLLAALVLVVLPLLPVEPLALIGGLQPRTLGLLAALILVLQGAGHVALRLFGPAAGLALSGLFSGFVSSTATIASMGARARREPALGAACEGGAMLSTAATWLQALVMLAAVAPPLALAVAPAAAAGFGVAAGSGAWRARGARADHVDGGRGGPLRVREALLVALLLGAVSVAVGWAQRRFGTGGALAGVALSALADAHSSITALGMLQSGGQLLLREAALGVGVAVTANSLTRTVTAFVAGGRAYGLRLGASLALSTAAGWGVLLATALR